MKKNERNGNGESIREEFQTHLKGGTEGREKKGTQEAETSYEFSWMVQCIQMYVSY
jgi:hypothetical protein